MHREVVAKYCQQQCHRSTIRNGSIVPVRITRKCSIENLLRTSSMRCSAFYRSSRRARNAGRILLYVVLIVGALKSAEIAAAVELIVMRNDGVTVRLELEYVRDPVALKEGLMWCKSLAPRNGMLFDFRRARIVHMWMKNTFIPLDMLFVTQTGRVVKIERNLSPHSVSSITSTVPVRYVIEINADEARQLGLNIGDRVLLDNIQSLPDVSEDSRSRAPTVPSIKISLQTMRRALPRYLLRTAEHLSVVASRHKT